MRCFLLLISCLGFLASGPHVMADDAVPDRAEDVRPIERDHPLPNSRVRRLDGVEVGLHDVLGNSPALLVFYRGGWCPYCNRQLGDLRRIEADLQALGYRIVAVSPDSPERLREGLDKTPVNYTLLSDGAAQLIRALGIAFRVDAETREKYRAYGIDLVEASGGHEHFLLPVPTVILADAEGIVRHIEFNADYRVRPSNDEVLAAARRHAPPQQTTE